MARGWKPKPTDEERLQNIAAERAHIIRSYMGLRGVRYDFEAAAGIKMSRATFSSKMKSGKFSADELVKIVWLLKIPAEDAAKMLGVSA